MVAVIITLPVRAAVISASVFHPAPTHLLTEIWKADAPYPRESPKNVNEVMSGHLKKSMCAADALNELENGKFVELHSTIGINV
mmetsp:Transcript_31833/g.36350  ORF Transcript_31833/g.36350 Transcript_31833/m.36350 type:complete len:84 (+) Transcript_31833:88-339(+)